MLNQERRDGKGRDYIHRRGECRALYADKHCRAGGRARRGCGADPERVFVGAPDVLCAAAWRNGRAKDIVHLAAVAAQTGRAGTLRQARSHAQPRCPSYNMRAVHLPPVRLLDYVKKSSENKAKLGFPGSPVL